MYCNYDNAIGITAVVYTVFAVQASELPLKQLCIECFISYTTALLYTVETMLEFPNVAFEARLDESFWLCHVIDFIGLEDAIEEHSFDVELLNFPVQGSAEMCENTERLHVCCGESSLSVVLTVCI